jgi:hypothetical protein
VLAHANSSRRSIYKAAHRVLKALHPKNLAKSNDENYLKRIQELEGLYSEHRTDAQRGLDALNRQLDYLKKRHAFRESKAIKTLTKFASIYLHLSLSASILGMQSPFKAIAHDLTSSPQDLTRTNLLFDFFDVFIGLSSGTVFILYSIKLGLWAKSTRLGMLTQQFSGAFSILYCGRRWRYGGVGGNIFEVIRALHCVVDRRRVLHHAPDHIPLLHAKNSPKRMGHCQTDLCDVLYCQWGYSSGFTLVFTSAYISRLFEVDRPHVRIGASTYSFGIPNT